MKKISINIVFLIAGAILAAGVLHGSGLNGLFGGVNIKNTPALFLSDFIVIALLLFNNMGLCENYLNGYGKYRLLRHKKRQIMMFGIYKKTALYVCLLTASRILIYTVVLKVIGDNIVFKFNDTLNYVMLLILALIFLCLIQYLFELKFSSAVGLMVTMLYYIFSISISGILAEKNIYLPILFLIPNYYMKNRSRILINETGISEWLLYFILVTEIIALIILSGKVLKKKDIF